MNDEPEIGTIAEATCCICGQVTECIFDADPFESEINNDSTPVWECKACRHQQAMEV